MSKITTLKLNRKFQQLQNGSVVPRPNTIPAYERQILSFDYKGVHFDVQASPGQIINKERMYKKYLKNEKKKY